MVQDPGDGTTDPPADQREREVEETRVERTDRTRSTASPSSEGLSAGDRIAGWFTETAVRGGIALLGVVLVLFAVGQIVGIELLGSLVDFLTSSLGAWLIVGLLGVLLIVAASRSWNLTSSME